MGNNVKNNGWVLLNESTPYQNNYFSVKDHRVKLPNGHETNFIYVSRPPAVMVTPLFDNKSVVLVRQFRYLAGKESWEFPAGTINHNEEPIFAATRELEEEAGYIARKISLLNKVYTSNGSTNELVYIYIASDLVCSNQKLEESEFGMVAKVFSINECMNMVTKRIIDCAGTILSLFQLKYFLETNSAHLYKELK